MFFKCKHPLSMLGVRKKETVQQVDDNFECVTYHFICFKCNSDVTKGYSRLIHGVENFLGKAL